MKNLMVSLILIFGILLLRGPALAQSRRGELRPTKVVSVKGTVTDFRFINPHVQIYMMWKNDRARSKSGPAKARSPSMLGRYWRLGLRTRSRSATWSLPWHRTSNGTNFLRLMKIVLPDGRRCRIVGARRSCAGVGEGPHAQIPRKSVDGPIGCKNWNRRTDSDNPREFSGRESIPFLDQKPAILQHYWRSNEGSR